jgi:hypothetical protein
VGRTSPTRRNLFTHLTAAVVVPGCIALCWWQVGRALSGNTLSWAYVFEWPIFAGYGVFMWWKLIHEQPARDRSGPHPPVAADPDVPGAGDDATPDKDQDQDQDEDLASYNRYLAALHASGKRKHW